MEILLGVGKKNRKALFNNKGIKKKEKKRKKEGR
jgi:hypothetical protein